MPTHDALRSVLSAVVGGVLLVGISGLAQSPQARRTQWDGIYTGSQADRGERIYQQQCVSCHSLESPNDRQPAPLLFGNAFTGNWDKLTLEELTIRTQGTMPPDRPGSLTLNQSADIVAYMLLLDGAPFGDTELPASRSALRELVVAQRQP